MLGGLQPWLRPYAEYLLSHHPEARLTSTYRSRSAQLKLWRNRHTNPYPVAPPGTSYHERGRAFDVVAPTTVLRSMGAMWRQMGGKWFESDPIHFQA